MCQMDADGIANSKTLIRLFKVYTVCPDLSVRKLRKFTVLYEKMFYGLESQKTTNKQRKQQQKIYNIGQNQKHRIWKKK